MAHFLVFGQLQTIPARVDDINRVAGAFAVKTQIVYFDSLGLQLLD